MKPCDLLAVFLALIDTLPLQMAQAMIHSALVGHAEIEQAKARQEAAQKEYEYLCMCGKV